MRAAVIWHRFGPYHHARLRSAGRIGEVVGIEMSSVDRTYQWTPVAGSFGFRKETVYEGSDCDRYPPQKIAKALMAVLDKVNPTVVFVPSWGANYANAAHLWCLRKKVPCVVMCESSERDRDRRWLKEGVKKRLVPLYSAGFVGGSRHRDYLIELGMRSSVIYAGYDAVDNDYFQRGAASARAESGTLCPKNIIPDRFFLCIGRLVQKKNHRGLLVAFRRYVERVGSNAAFAMVIVGSGPELGAIERLRHQLDLDALVHMLPFAQYEELPSLYGRATVFVCPSIQEQWGLVVNEAAASGLPMLVSEHCGCAPELVRDGYNGYLFLPTDTLALSDAMVCISSAASSELVQMGKRSQELVASCSLDAFATGLWQAAEAAVSAEKKTGSLFDRAILSLLTMKKNGVDQ